MNWSVLRLLYVHELKMLVRARRTVVMAVVLPAVIMPLMLYAQKFSSDRRERILTGLDELFTILPRPADQTSSMVLITGPSRTADIEQILVRGVHGPGQISVIVVG